MATLELLQHLIELNTNHLSKKEIIFLEVELYDRIFHEMWMNYKTQYKDYFHLFEFNVEKENLVMELHIIRFLINDMLKGQNYTLEGIARYTQTPEEIVEDLLMGHKISPLVAFTRKLIELHKLLKPELYKNVIKKLNLQEIKDNPDNKTSNVENLSALAEPAVIEQLIKDKENNAQ